MKFGQVVATADRVKARGRRLAKIEALSELIQSAPPAHLAAVVNMLSGEIPGGKIGVGFATVREATSTLDEPAEGPPLRLETVLETLSFVREESGAGSKQRRIDHLRNLFGTAEASERSFLLRLLTGELRQGALGGLMVEALARATGIDASKLRRALMIRGDLAEVAVAAMQSGVAAVEAIGIEVFRPLQPMLASPIEDIEAALARVPAERLAVETKLDGARVQVHRDGERVRVYSRQLNDVTHSVPEVVEIALAASESRFVADGEAFAVREDGSIHSFQTTMRRFGRGHRVQELRRRLPLDVRFFDLMLIGSDELIDQPLEERWRRLEALLPNHQARRQRLPGSEGAAGHYESSLDQGHEGVMLKDLRASYEAGRRGFAWLKLKPTHTLDLVVLAVEKGSGRRSGWLSNLHLGARDEETGHFVMLGKTFKGLTDAMLTWQTEYFANRTESLESGFIHHVTPSLVVEVAFNNIQASPQYPAGMALRFARVKAHRPDKDLAQASDLEEVRAIYRQEHGNEPTAPDASKR